MSSSASNFSYLISGVIAGMTPVLALLYTLGLFLLYRFSLKHPRKFKTAVGLWLQRYFPGPCSITVELNVADCGSTFSVLRIFGVVLSYRGNMHSIANMAGRIAEEL